MAAMIELLDMIGDKGIVFHLSCVVFAAVCPECGKKFSRVASLKAHIMLHERDESLICPECGDEFGVQVRLLHVP